MVSRKYLSAWGDERGRLDVIDLEAPRGYTTTFERATIHSYVYEAGLLEHSDLEGQYGKVETAGIPALRKLENGVEIGRDEQHAVIAFLDMHLERGNYANQSKILTPAVAVMNDGTSQEVDLKLADRLILSRCMEGATSLLGQGLEDWPWAVYEGHGLVTGDGAVLRWAESKQNNALCTVTFPLSPSAMLVIGHPIGLDLPINEVLVSKCRRWIVGKAGTLTKDPVVLASVIDQSSDDGQQHDSSNLRLDQR